MLRFVSILFVGLFLFAQESFGQVCHVQGYPDNVVRLPPQNETLPGNVIMANLQLVDVETTTTVAHPHNVYVQALRYPNGVYELMTTATFKDFITAERTGQITRQANLYCSDGTTVVRVTFIIPVADVNDKAPTFDKAEYNASVEIPANPTDETTLIETRMIVSDADYEPENAQVEFTSNHPAFTPTATPLWNGSYPVVYEYEVNILVNNTVSSGVYLINITGSDGVNEGSATVEITVVTEVQEDCGFLGLDSDVPITVPQPLDPNSPEGTEVWRGTLVNVASTTTVPGEHNQYLMGIRQQSDYFFLTTEDFLNFEEEQETNVLLRTVNLTCERGDVIQYSFRLDVASKSTPEPTSNPTAVTTPADPETTTESGEEPIMGEVDFERCGGFGTFHELRVQGSEGAAANMTAGMPYQITGTYATVSASNFVRLALSTTFEGEEMTLVELEVPDSGYAPGQNVTARFQVTLPQTLSGEALRLVLNLSNHNSILEACISFAANIF